MQWLGSSSSDKDDLVTVDKMNTRQNGIWWPRTQPTPVAAALIALNFKRSKCKMQMIILCKFSSQQVLITIMPCLGSSSSDTDDLVTVDKMNTRQNGIWPRTLLTPVAAAQIVRFYLIVK